MTNFRPLQSLRSSSGSTGNRKGEEGGRGEWGGEIERKGTGSCTDRKKGALYKNLQLLKIETNKSTYM